MSGSLLLFHIKESSSLEQLMEALPIGITALLILLIVIVSFDWCGRCHYNACLVDTLAIVMFILFVLQVALTCRMIGRRHEFLNEIRDRVDTLWAEGGIENEYQIGTMEFSLKCCGNNNYTDYIAKAAAVPGTCCGRSNRNSICSPEIYKKSEGCNAKFTRYLQNNSVVTYWLGVGRCIYEFIVFLMAAIIVTTMCCSKSTEQTMA